MVGEGGVGTGLLVQQVFLMRFRRSVACFATLARWRARQGSIVSQPWRRWRRWSGIGVMAGS